MQHMSEIELAASDVSEAKVSRMTHPSESHKAYDAYVLYAIGFLFLPVAAVATLQTWILAVAGALAIVILRTLRGDIIPRVPGILVAVFGVFIAWAALTSIWSLVPDRAMTTSLRLLLVGVCLLFLSASARALSDAERLTFGKWLIAGTALGLIIIAVLISFSGIIAGWLNNARITGHELDRLNRTAGVIAMLVWPAALIIARLYGRYAAAAVIVSGALALFALAPATPLFAFVIGIGAFAVTWFSQKWGKRLLILAFAVSVIVIPFLDTLVPVANDILVTNMTWPNSEVHRFVIWEFASQRIFENPLFGWGLEASRAIPGGDAQLFLFNINGDNPLTGQALPLHPHSAVIQIWLELGVVGVMLLGGLFSVIIQLVPESLRDRAGPATIVATIACGFTIAQLGFGIWQGWWMGTLGLIAVIVVAIAPVSEQARAIRNAVQAEPV